MLIKGNDITVIHHNDMCYGEIWRLRISYRHTVENIIENLGMSREEFCSIMDGLGAKRDTAIDVYYFKTIQEAVEAKEHLMILCSLMGQPLEDLDAIKNTFTFS